MITYLVYLIVFIFLLYLLEFIISKIYFKQSFLNSINSLKWKNNLKFIFDNDKNISLKYIPSSQTNWTLNPFYKNEFDQVVHYREGFRKTCNLNNIIDKVNSKKIKIILLGSSSTYCTDISKNSKTWPQLLQENNSKYEIFNFGVPHFTLLQTNNRLISWVNKIKPDLVILYQAKNDLNYISNIPDNIDYVNYDYENIQSQFSIALKEIMPKKLNLPFYNFIKLRKLQSINFDILYRSKVNTERLKNYKKYEIVESVVAKTVAIASFCKSLNIDFIYIPEIVIGGYHKNILEKDIYPSIKNKLSNFTNSKFIDISDIINNSPNYFFDNMHFNIKGCKIFSEIIGAKIDEFFLKKINK